MSVVVLTGGVGGAKLVDGLARILPPGEVTAIVNTGDDFVHLGLHISPDIDSVFYLLAGKSDAERGWGVANESWRFMEMIGELGGPTWFNLGDLDLAMHVMRTAALGTGKRLTDYTAEMAKEAGVGVNLLPMSECPVRTVLDTDAGVLAFQNYFVQHQCNPKVARIRFDGAADAKPTPEVVAALEGPSVEAIVIAPSNPYLSIDPILSIAAIRDALCSSRAPVVAVSPIVDGKAVKGPTAKLMSELGVEISHGSIARHYSNLIDGLLVDEGTDLLRNSCPEVVVHSAHTMMREAADRMRVARAVLDLAKACK